MPCSIIVPEGWTECYPYGAVIVPVLEDPPAAKDLYILGPGEVPSPDDVAAVGALDVYHTQQGAPLGDWSTMKQQIDDIWTLLVTYFEGFAPS